MSTQRETVDFILEKLGDMKTFKVRAMFGEYALYANGVVVALICDDQLYVKIHPESERLEAQCEKADPYPGAKPYYLIEESQLSHFDFLPSLLKDLAKGLPKPKRRS